MPENEKTEKEVIQDHYAEELQGHQEVAVFANSSGGKRLLTTSKKQAEKLILTLMEEYKNPELPRLLALLASLDASINMIAVLAKAKDLVEATKIVIEGLGNE